MRTINTIIFTFLALMICSIYIPSLAEAVPCQNTTAIVYSNGIFNDAEAANTSKKELFKKLTALTPAFADSNTYEFHLAYATNGGANNPFSLSGLEQLLEVGRQIFGDKSTDLFWLALTRGIGKIADKTLPQPAADLINQIIPNAPPPAFRKAMQDISLTIDQAAFVNDIDFGKMMNGGNGFDGYRTLLGSGKRMVIVAHSQGNFYANRVYRTLADPAYGGNAALAVSIGVVAVATPANVSPGGKLGLNEPNITVPEDYVIAPVRTALGSLAAKPANVFWSQNMNELRLGAWADASIGHNFVEWYLTGTYTRNFILNGIVTTIAGPNGVGGLKYPTQGCTTPVIGPVIPQPGPYYYRDDWGDLTYLRVKPDKFGYTLNDQYWQFKNLRDDVRGLAYRVDMQRTHVGRARNAYAPPYRLTITITDYTNNVSGVIRYSFPDNFKPDDVLLWSGGLVLVSYNPAGNASQIAWRKFSIQDAGAGTVNRWSIQSVTPGLFDQFPSYNLTSTIRRPNGGYSYQVTPRGKLWKKRGTAYRDGATYAYRIPYTAREAQWTNAPGGRYGYWLNGVYQNEPVLQRKTYSGEYGVLVISDGSLAFQKGGSVQLETINGIQPAQKPIVNGFAKIKQIMAYKYTQSFLADADLVDEAGILQWNSYGAPALQAELANGEKFFAPPKGFHRSYRRGPAASRFYPNSEIFVPFSLSDSMAMLWVDAVYEAWFSQPVSRYKLGPGFRINSTDPRLQATNPPMTMPIFTRMQGINSWWSGVYNQHITLTPEQKVFMENAVNSVP